MKEILVGTSNRSKVEFYQHVLRGLDITILLPERFPKLPRVEEHLFDIKGNSVNKAIAFATSTGIPAISDDTGIFIPALNNEPGVAVRRWAGNLPENISDEDWIVYMRNKIIRLKDDELDCYKHKVICIATPDLRHEEVSIVTSGRVLKDVNQPTFIEGAPFSAFFFLDKFGKTEAELTKEELDKHTKEARKQILTVIQRLGVITG